MHGENLKNHINFFMPNNTLFFLMYDDSYIGELVKFYVISRSPYCMIHCTLKFYIFSVNISYKAKKTLEITSWLDLALAVLLRYYKNLSFFTWVHIM
jgi:hypothetical protein